MVTHASCAAEVLCVGNTLYYGLNGPDTIGLKDPEDVMILGLVVLGITTGWCFSNAQGNHWVHCAILGLHAFQACILTLVITSLD